MPTLRKLPLAAGLAFLLGGTLPDATVLAPVPAAAPSPLDDLAWLSGTWRHEEESGDMEEETWSSPRADAMVGMLRMAQRGRVNLYELMSIELDGPAGSADGPLIPGQEPVAGGAPQRLVFHLRHFQRGLVPWEAEKSGPLTFTIKSLAPNEAVFEDPARDFPRELVYRREGDLLKIRLVSATAAKKDMEFVMKRVKD